MKKLCIMRHAFSPSLPGQKDHERPLASCARKECEKIGLHLNNLPFSLTLIAASDASRTKETSARILENLTYKPFLQFFPEFYKAKTEDLFYWLKNQEEDISNILLIGHNPAVHSLCHLLFKEAKNTASVEQMSLAFPPASLAIFTLPYDKWHKLSPASAILEQFITP